MEPISVPHAIILGVLQGIAEFLPISSSAHLIVASSALGGRTMPLTMTVALHLGTLGAVLIYFWKDWLNLAGALWARVFKGKKSFESDELFPGLILGSIPAAFFGLMWEDQIEAYFHNPLSVVLPIALVGIGLWLVDIKAPSTRGLKDITWRDSFLIGIGQACALIPGFSRSGSTILAGRLLKIRREDAARYSFLLGTPAMGGAALLEAKRMLALAGDPALYAGIAASLATGCVCIGFLLRFLRRFGFLAFAVYRLAFAVAVVAWFTVAR
jgi:undecaprenyl-diphosphatase